MFIGTKIKYQVAGQNLERFRFRPYAKDWIELTILARARGGSATLLFVLLMELDINEPIERESWGELDVLKGMWLPERPIRFFQSLALGTGLWNRILKYGRSSYNSYENHRYKPRI